jgi:hypothetical protein
VCRQAFWYVAGRQTFLSRKPDDWKFKRNERGGDREKERDRGIAVALDDRRLEDWESRGEVERKMGKCQGVATGFGNSPGWNAR